jgi:malonyl-CoA/methylmalonyl-CoA synthetase
MKSGGYKIYPQEIERALAPALPECETIVVGLPSTHWGEVICAVAASPPPDWEARARAACAGLTPFKRPRLHVAVDALPRNGQGKLVRRLLVDALLRDWTLIDGPRPRLEERALEKR